MATVVYNAEKNGLEVHFPGKPEQEVLDTLKAAKFRWSKRNRFWFTKNTQRAREALESLSFEIPDEAYHESNQAAEPLNASGAPENPATPSQPKKPRITTEQHIEAYRIMSRGLSPTDKSIGFTLEHRAYYEHNTGEVHVYTYRNETLSAVKIGKKGAVNRIPNDDYYLVKIPGDNGYAAGYPDNDYYYLAEKDGFLKIYNGPSKRFQAIEKYEQLGYSPEVHPNRKKNIIRIPANELQGAKAINQFEYEEIEIPSIINLPPKDRKPAYDFQKQPKINRKVLEREVFLGKIEVKLTERFDGMTDSRESVNNPTFELPEQIPIGLDSSNSNSLLTYEYENPVIGYVLKLYSGGTSMKLKYYNKKLPAKVDLSVPIPQRYSAPAGASNEQMAKNFEKMASSYLQKARDMEQSLEGREVNTPKKASEAKLKEIEAAQTKEKGEYAGALAEAYKEGNVPEMLKNISPIQNRDHLNLFVSDLDRPGYYSAVLTDKAKFMKMPRAVVEREGQEMGLKTYEAVQQAFDELNELHQRHFGTPQELSESERNQKRIKELIEELRFSNRQGFVPTPEDLAARMVAMAEIQPDDRVLDPSAGIGSIADAVKAEHAEQEVHVAEIAPKLQEVLKLKGHYLVSGDFMAYQDCCYDVIVMNPPYERRQDIEHLYHAYNLLEDGGRLVCLVSQGSLDGSGNREENFNNFLTTNEAYIERLEPDAFENSFIPKKVNAALIYLTKPEQQQNPDEFTSEEIPEPADDYGLYRQIYAKLDDYQTRSMEPKLKKAADRLFFTVKDPDHLRMDNKVRFEGEIRANERRQAEWVKMEALIMEGLDRIGKVKVGSEGMHLFKKHRDRSMDIGPAITETGAEFIAGAYTIDEDPDSGKPYVRKKALSEISKENFVKYVYAIGPRETIGDTAMYSFSPDINTMVIRNYQPDHGSLNAKSPGVNYEVTPYDLENNTPVFKTGYDISFKDLKAALEAAYDFFHAQAKGDITIRMGVGVNNATPEQTGTENEGNMAKSTKEEPQATSYIDELSVKPEVRELLKDTPLPDTVDELMDRAKQLRAYAIRAEDDETLIYGVFENGEKTGDLHDYAQIKRNFAIDRGDILKTNPKITGEPTEFYLLTESISPGTRLYGVEINSSTLQYTSNRVVVGVVGSKYDILIRRPFITPISPETGNKLDITTPAEQLKAPGDNEEPRQRLEEDTGVVLTEPYKGLPAGKGAVVIQVVHEENGVPNYRIKHALNERGSPQTEIVPGSILRQAEVELQETSMGRESYVEKGTGPVTTEEETGPRVDPAPSAAKGTELAATYYLPKNRKDQVFAWYQLPPAMKAHKAPSVPKYKLDPTDKGLRRLLDPFIGKDELRPALTGVYYDGDKIVATDGNKLAAIPANLPKKKQGILDADGSTIDEHFPDYKAVIPQDKMIQEEYYRYTIDTMKLMAFLNTLVDTPFVNPTTRQIVFPLPDKRLIASNGKFLYDSLAFMYKMGYETLDILLHKDGNKPITLLPEGGNTTDSTLALVMPVVVPPDQVDKEETFYGTSNSLETFIAAQDYDFGFKFEGYYDLDRNQVYSKGYFFEIEPELSTDEVEKQGGIIDKDFTQALKKTFHKRQASLPVLEYVLIEGNYAYAMDLETGLAIQLTEPLPDGLYHRGGGYLLLTKEPVEDFPAAGQWDKTRVANRDDVPTTFEEASDKLQHVGKVSGAGLRDIFYYSKDFQGKDDLRPALTGATIKPQKDHLEINVTNGGAISRLALPGNTQEHPAFILPSIDKQAELLSVADPETVDIYVVEGGRRSGGSITYIEAPGLVIRANNIDENPFDFDTLFSGATVEERGYTVPRTKLQKALKSYVKANKERGLLYTGTGQGKVYGLTVSQTDYEILDTQELDVEVGDICTFYSTQPYGQFVNGLYQSIPGIPKEASAAIGAFNNLLDTGDKEICWHGAKLATGGMASRVIYESIRPYIPGEPAYEGTGQPAQTKTQEPNSGTGKALEPVFEENVETEFLPKRKSVTDKIKKREGFLAVAPRDLKPQQMSFDENIHIAAIPSRSLSSIAKRAKQKGLTDSNYSIYQIIQDDDLSNPDKKREYYIDENAPDTEVREEQPSKPDPAPAQPSATKERPIAELNNLPEFVRNIRPKRAGKNADNLELKYRPDEIYEVSASKSIRLKDFEVMGQAYLKAARAAQRDEQAYIVAPTYVGRVNIHGLQDYMLTPGVYAIVWPYEDQVYAQVADIDYAKAPAEPEPEPEQQSKKERIRMLNLRRRRKEKEKEKRRRRAQRQKNSPE